MAHLANPDRSYRLLQQRLDRNVTGAPDSPAFTQILKLLFSPEDAEIARQMPTTFVSVTRLARKLETEPTATSSAWTGPPRRSTKSLPASPTRARPRPSIACASP